MIADLDIYHAAKMLVDQHGRGALAHVDRRVEQLLEDGDFEGVRIWRTIMSAVEELQRERRDGEAVN
jgi:hypothetical protein